MFYREIKMNASKVLQLTYWKTLDMPKVVKIIQTSSLYTNYTVSTVSTMYTK
jgi:hypothetical protein